MAPVAKPGLEESPSALWVPPKGLRAGLIDISRRRHESHSVSRSSNASRKARQCRQSTIGSKSIMLRRVRIASHRGGARHARHLRRQGSLIDLGRHGMRRRGSSKAGAGARSSGSAASRATGVTSEEPTVEGTRGDPIGVIVSLRRNLAQDGASRQSDG